MIDLSIRIHHIDYHYCVDETMRIRDFLQLIKEERKIDFIMSRYVYSFLFKEKISISKTFLQAHILSGDLIILDD